MLTKNSVARRTGSLRMHGKAWIRLASFICLLLYATANPVRGDLIYGGQGIGLQATVLGIPTTVADTGLLPSVGGSLSASAPNASINVPGTLTLTSDTLMANTSGVAGIANADASVVNFNLTVGLSSVTADLIEALSDVDTSGGLPPTIGGSSIITNLFVNGSSVTVTGNPNQSLPFLGGTIFINEQISSTTPTSGDITVNGLHIILPGTADIIVSSAHSDLTSAVVPEPASVFSFGIGALMLAGVVCRRWPGVILASSS